MLGTLTQFLAGTHSRERINARRVRSSQMTPGERRAGKGEQVDSRISVPGSTSNDIVVSARSCVFARSAFRPSPPPVSSLSLSHPMSSARHHSRRAALSGSARKSGAARRREKRETEREIPPQTPAIRRRERRTKDGARATDADATRRESGAEGDGWRKGRRTRDAKGDAKETTKRSNAKMAPERDTAARNSRQFRAKLLGAGRARTLASRRRAAPLRPAYLM